MTNLRCKNCNKKLGLIPFSCKCNYSFCSKCRYPEEHNCEYNFKKHDKDILKKKLVKVVAKKIEII